VVVVVIVKNLVLVLWLTSSVVDYIKLINNYICIFIWIKAQYNI